MKHNVRFFKSSRPVMLFVIIIVLWGLSGVRIYFTKMIPNIGLNEETKGSFVIMTFERPCPPELASSTTNTNLFSLNERSLIESIFSDRKQGIRKVGVITNSIGDVYGITSGFDDFFMYQVNRGMKNGLAVRFKGDNCVSWMYYSNGLAVDKWLQWLPSGSLYKYVKFNEPYDFHPNTRLRLKIKYNAPWPFN